MARIIYPSLQAPPPLPFNPPATPLSEPVQSKAKQAFIARMASGEVLDPFPRGTPEFIGPDKWWQPFSTRLFAKPGLHACRQQFIAQSESAQFPEVVYIDKYLYPFGIPKRFPARLMPGLNQFEAFVDWSIARDTEPVYHQPFSEPKRFPLRLFAGTQPYLFPSNDPVIDISWFSPFSEPKRFKPELIKAANPTFCTGAHALGTPFARGYIIC